MSWQKTSDYDSDHIDARTGTHNIHLSNPHTEGIHKLHIMVGADACPTCGRPHPQGELGTVNPKAIVAEAIEMLNANHVAVLEYAATHNIPIKVGPNAQLIPGATVLSRASTHRIVSVPRKAQL